jgi:hypothetical protein
MNNWRRSFLRGLLFFGANLGLGSHVRALAKKSPLVDELSGNFVLKGETRSIKVASQMAFRPKRLVIPGNIGMNFLVKDILVQNKSQLVIHKNSEGVPGAVFSEMAFGALLKMDHVDMGGEVEIIVENISKQAQRFCSAIIGSSLERPGEFVLGMFSDDPIYAEALREVDALTPGSPRVS